MKVTVVYGVMHKGSTYHCVKLLLEEIEKQVDLSVTEIFLPKAMPHFCVGCFSCFVKDENLCPHYEAMNPIVQSLEDSDLIILASPVYVYNVSGQMKAFLDHMGYRWMVHRPHEKMFQKLGVVVSTTAGAGIRHTNKTMKINLNFWGVKRIFSFGKAVAAINWEGVNSKKKIAIQKEMKGLSVKLVRAYKKADSLKPKMKTRILFTVMKNLQKKAGWNEVDTNYWKEHGWLDGKKPW